MSYQATVLADSISPDGVRLTTIWVTFPRFILAEVNTHRMLSRNSNSSRAIPPERQISAVRDNPFVPETFNKRVKGMGVGDALDELAADEARQIWLRAAHDAANSAEVLNRIGLDKSRINRLLEPFLWHSAVITATEWSNFFALRDSPQAQPEFQITARLMREAMEQSEPRPLLYGEWHLPGLTYWELNGLERPISTNEWDYLKRVSAGRLARWTSYAKEGDYEEPEAAYARCDKLISSFHLSPLEHQARPFYEGILPAARRLRENERELAQSLGLPFDEWAADQAEFNGNFRGWTQFRKEIPNESDASRAL